MMRVSLFTKNMVLPLLVLNERLEESLGGGKTS